MPRTFEEAQEEKAEERAEEGYFSESPIRFQGSDLLGRFRDFVDDLVPFPEPGQIPDLPGGGDGLPGIDIDIDQASQRELLALIAQAQLFALQRLNTITQFVSPPSTVTVSGTNVIDDADEPQQVIEQSVPTRLLHIRADPENTEDIYFGDSDVEPQSGFVLRPGEARLMQIDYRNESLYMASESEDQVVQLLGVF